MASGAPKRVPYRKKKLEPGTIEVPGAIDPFKLMTGAEYSVFYAPIDNEYLLDGLPTESLRLADLHPTQRVVFEGEKGGEGDPYVLRWYDAMYLLDGHHRYMEAIKRGKKSLHCSVLDAPPTRFLRIEDAVAFLENATGCSLMYKQVDETTWAILPA